MVPPVRWLLGYEGVPFMARPTFRSDVLASLFGAFTFGVLTNQFLGLFALKALEAQLWLVSLLAAEMAAGNFMGVLLTKVLQRRRRVRTIVAARTTAGLFMASMGLLPPGPAGQGLLILLLAPTALALAINLNLQTSIRHSNYPSSHRGRIFARLTIVSMGAITLSVKLSAWLLDTLGSHGHRVVYPMAGAAMLISALLYSRIRGRSERAVLGPRDKQPFRPLDMLHGLSLLWKDRYFGQFMLWQLLSGSMVLMTMPLLTKVLKDVFNVSYSAGATALVAVPMITQMLFSIPVGRVFDRIPVGKFRALNASLWATSWLVLFYAAWTGWWMGILLGYFVQGLGRSLGHMAFNLGHTRFAPPEKSGQYMGLHMTLQGFRGITMPFVGKLLYENFDLGVRAIAVAGVLQLIAAVGFFFCPAPPGEAEEIARA